MTEPVLSLREIAYRREPLTDPRLTVMLSRGLGAVDAI
jgi:hypothetical protein